MLNFEGGACGRESNIECKISHIGFYISRKGFLFQKTETDI